MEQSSPMLKEESQEEIVESKILMLEKNEEEKPEPLVTAFESELVPVSLTVL